MIARTRPDKWTPRRLSNMRLWLDANDRSSLRNDIGGEIANGNFVSKWFCSRFGYEFNDQSSASKQPVWNSSGFGSKSKPYLQFDGVNDILLCTNASLLASLVADNVGTVIIIGANQTPGAPGATFTFLSTYRASGSSNGFSFITRDQSLNGRAGVRNWQAGVRNEIIQSQGTTSGLNEYLYHIGSDGVVYNLRTITYDTATVSWKTYTGKTTLFPTDDGDWFNGTPDVVNVALGAFKEAAEGGWSALRIAEIIITGTDIVNTPLELLYLERYMIQKYGTLNS